MKAGQAQVTMMRCIIECRGHVDHCECRSAVMFGADCSCHADSKASMPVRSKMLEGKQTECAMLWAPRQQVRPCVDCMWSLVRKAFALRHLMRRCNVSKSNQAAEGHVVQGF